MADIVQLQNDKNQDVFPITNTKAIYDDEGNRLDNVMLTAGKGTDSPDVLINAQSCNGVVLGIDGEGKRGYLEADGSFVPFKSGLCTIGEFITSATQYGKVEVNCQFKPKSIVVSLYLGNSASNITYAIYTEEMTTNSFWILPSEGKMYSIVLGSSTGETGITEITDNGFKFRSNAANTRGVRAKYYAIG